MFGKILDSFKTIDVYTSTGYDGTNSHYYNKKGINPPLGIDAYIFGNIYSKDEKFSRIEKLIMSKSEDKSQSMGHGSVPVKNINSHSLKTVNGIGYARTSNVPDDLFHAWIEVEVKLRIDANE